MAHNGDTSVRRTVLDSQSGWIGDRATGATTMLAEGVNVGIHQWSFCDTQKHPQHFIKELVPQTVPLLLVPCRRIR
jgi:hypothetical protein